MAKVKYINYKKPTININKGEKLMVSSQQPFNFVIKSDDSPEKEIYKKALLRSGEEISKALEIKNTINIDVYIEDFCKTLRSTACFSLVGMTYSPIYIALKDSSSPNEREYAYPQALVKQLNLDKEVDFSDHDLIIYLNTHMAKEDFSEIITTHEIIHGLGFMGNGVVIGKSIGIPNIKEELFSPYVYYDVENVAENKINYNMLGFLPFTVFEKNIVAIEDRDNYLYRTGFDEFFDNSVNITSYSLDFNSSSEEQFSVLSKIYSEIYKDNKSLNKYRKITKYYFTHNSIGFKCSDGEVVKLQTFNDVYLSSSSGNHMAVPFKCEALNTCYSNDINEYDNDYLMYYNFPIQFKSSEMLKKFKNEYGFIGPKLLKILTTMGWTEKGKESDSKIYYVSDNEFPDVYDYLFELKSNNTIFKNDIKETFLMSSSNLNHTYLKTNILLIFIISSLLFII
ncbi:hypothetical protein BCR32DRAFT_328336 [Anaeromyces robustus]|uniref:Uncharacterized protein n=1 Tax=Anaeromyces robustus TaxID=1754192 RepID=A0A1Y1WZP7_9FUNG|nr:hypothetical protein BCR32DRAFT_328336 [Anaeromyces robustus]|eukprot:ORX78912.1 hypothetical protein BCR32DRAFT_328336 [Anaeromyces robustus]